MILHTINKISALEKCLPMISPSDSVVLIEDGVNLALRELPFPVIALQKDVVARGLSDLINDTQLISYHEFVDLTEAADKVCAWY